MSILLQPVDIRLEEEFVKEVVFALSHGEGTASMEQLLAHCLETSETVAAPQSQYAFVKILQLNSIDANVTLSRQIAEDLHPLKWLFSGRQADSTWVRIPSLVVVDAVGEQRLLERMWFDQMGHALISGSSPTGRGLVIPMSVVPAGQAHLLQFLPPSEGLICSSSCFEQGRASRAVSQLLRSIAQMTVANGTEVAGVDVMEGQYGGRYGRRLAFPAGSVASAPTSPAQSTATPAGSASAQQPMTPSKAALVAKPAARRSTTLMTQWAPVSSLRSFGRSFVDWMKNRVDDEKDRSAVTAMQSPFGQVSTISATERKRRRSPRPLVLNGGVLVDYAISDSVAAELLSLFPGVFETENVLAFMTVNGRHSRIILTSRRLVLIPSVAKSAAGQVIPSSAVREVTTHESTLVILYQSAGGEKPEMSEAQFALSSADEAESCQEQLVVLLSDNAGVRQTV